MAKRETKIEKQRRIFGISKEAIAVRDAFVKQMVERMFKIAPHLTPADVPLARRYCELEHLVTLAFAEIRRRESAAMFNGVSDNLLNNYRRFASLQIQCANTLGLSPASRAALRLGKENPDDLVADFARDASIKQLG
jgi:phage terminase small subunit